MVILDENIPSGQAIILKGWGIAIRQIGRGIGKPGIKDDAIPALLHRHSPLTFFTRDRGFYQRSTCNRRYSVIYLDVAQDDAASFIRRTLKHPLFDTQAKRLGSVLHVTHLGIRFWELHAAAEAFAPWTPASLRHLDLVKAGHG